ncbi:DUF6888 family protein [Calothrix sp. PCC 6303]|uniref:DUF6888 family protein n=1 Tax=Calothrix sp. PCC 6303 TaxID=1170562 RepID=UPI0002A02478|nr:hypothetical protein [Calothrix sp. PCC 6303]AFZ03059.1 hypothetical protein Cal6303_4145 [Calothrix sp. PCC 6303]
MQPTLEQLRSLYGVCELIGDLLQPINLVRYDERVKRIVILVEEDIEIEIFPNGEVLIR